MSSTSSIAAAPIQRPVVVIERRESGAIDLPELWAYRELLFFLAWRDIQVRYKQTLLGVLWALIQPLASMAIFSVFFGRIAGFAVTGAPYILYAYTGFVLWTFVSNAVTTASNSLVGSAYLVTKVYFPRILIPMAATAAAVVDFLLGLLPLAVMLWWYRIPPSWSWFFSLAAFSATLVLALSVGTVLSAFNAKYRDVRHAVPFAVQLWMFATPTFYSLDIVPLRWRWIANANPATGLLEAFRRPLLGLPIGDAPIGLALSITLALTVVALVVFRRMERRLADVI